MNFDTSPTNNKNTNFQHFSNQSMEGGWKSNGERVKTLTPGEWFTGGVDGLEPAKFPGKYNSHADMVTFSNGETIWFSKFSEDKVRALEDNGFKIDSEMFCPDSRNMYR